MDLHELYISYVWFMIILGGGVAACALQQSPHASQPPRSPNTSLLPGTTGLFIASGCGKNLTHWSPIYAGWGVGGFVFMVSLKMCGGTKGCMY